MRYVVTKDEIYSTNNQNGGNEMKKLIAGVACVLVAMMLTAVATFIVTMDNVRITTDDGENAVVECFGQTWWKVIFASDETEWR